MPRAAAPLVLLALVLAGCASDEDPARGWTFTQRAGAHPDETPAPLGEAVAFDETRVLTATDRQVGGQWHGNLTRDETLTLRFDASVPMQVAFRLVGDGGVTASGECDWAADATEEKPIGIARIRMRSTNTTCAMELTPTVTLAPSAGRLRWEARAADAPTGPWTLAFEASR